MSHEDPEQTLIPAEFDCPVNAALCGSVAADREVSVDITADGVAAGMAEIKKSARPRASRHESPRRRGSVYPSQHRPPPLPLWNLETERSLTITYDATMSISSAGQQVVMTGTATRTYTPKVDDSLGIAVTMDINGRMNNGAVMRMVVDGGGYLTR